jgi:peroxiredoxin Q/BCP
LPLAEGDTAPTVTVRGISSEETFPCPGFATVIFFYPTNQGSTCVNEIIDFDRRLAEFASIGVKLVGVSTEVVSEAASLKVSRHLTLPLFSDPHGEASALYGVKNVYGFSDRYTFLISGDRKVLAVWQAFDTVGHAEEVLKRCRAEYSG